MWWSFFVFITRKAHVEFPAIADGRGTPYSLETGGRRGEETEEERSGSKSEGGSAQAGGGRGTKTARERAAGDREG